MGNDKKYYWLKFQKDFFSSKRIKKLRKLAGGDTYTIIYLKMQLLAIDTGGIIEYTGLEESFAEELALDIDESADNVAVTVNYLLSCGLLIEKDNEFFLPYVVENTGADNEGLDKVREQTRKRVANYREKQKLIESNVTSNVTSNASNALEKEKEIEKEKELEIEKDKKETYVSIIAAYAATDELLIALNDYVEMRKKMKGFTTRALKLNLKELDKLAFDEHIKAEIVNQSVMHGWKAFYALKNKQKTNTVTSNPFIEMLMESEN